MLEYCAYGFGMVRAKSLLKLLFFQTISWFVRIFAHE